MNPWLFILPVTFAIGLGAGWSMRGDREDAKRLTGYVQAVEKREQTQQAVDALAVEQAATAAQQAVKDRIITREVIRYVQVTPAADRCTLPGTWRVRHDAAATGEPGEAAELAAGAAESVADDTALGVVAENYTACRGYIEQVAGWQAWCRTVGLCP